MADDDEKELEDGQEPCPVCGTIIWPGAMEFCEHYLWTHWDGQAMWEIKAATELMAAASDFVALIEEAAANEWLASVVALLIENGKTEHASLARQGWHNQLDEVLVDDLLMAGEERETGGMLSGGGYSVFVPRPATQWAKERAADLQATIALISQIRPGVQ